MVGRADFDVIKSQYAAKNRNTLLNRNPADNSLGMSTSNPLLQGEHPDEQGRIQADHAVQEYLLDQAYVIPLFEEPQVFALHRCRPRLRDRADRASPFYNTQVQR